MSNMTGGQGRSTNSGIRSTFCQATPVQRLTGIYAVRFFARILTDDVIAIVSIRFDSD